MQKATTVHSPQSTTPLQALEGPTKENRGTGVHCPDIQGVEYTVSFQGVEYTGPLQGVCVQGGVCKQGVCVCVRVQGMCVFTECVRVQGVCVC